MMRRMKRGKRHSSSQPMVVRTSYSCQMPPAPSSSSPLRPSAPTRPPSSSSSVLPFLLPDPSFLFPSPLPVFFLLHLPFLNLPDPFFLFLLLPNHPFFLLLLLALPDQIFPVLHHPPVFFLLFPTLSSPFFLPLFALPGLFRPPPDYFFLLLTLPLLPFLFRLLAPDQMTGMSDF